MSLRARLAIAMAGLAAVSVGVVGVLAVHSARGELRHRIDADLLERVAPIVEGAPPAGFPEAVRPPRGGPRRFRPRDDVFRALVAFDAVAQLVARDGGVAVVLDDTELPVDRDVLEAARTGPVLVDVDVDGVSHRMVTVALRSGGFLQIARSLDEVEAAVAGLRDRVLVTGLVLVAAAAALGWLLARQLVEPLRRLTRTARRVADTGDVGQVVEVSGGGAEVASLAASFTAMLGALDESRRRQHRLVMDASHELRTPLTSLRTNLEVLKRLDELDPDDRVALLTDLEAEAAELGELAAELVDVATEVPVDAPVESTTLDEIAGPVVERVRRRSGRDVVLDVRGRAPVEVRPDALARAVRNLVDNAVKFSPDGSVVRVVVDGRRLEVHDSGPGVPPEERELVFDRFHRLEATRSRPGSGLGLAIVKSVVESHGGRVWIDGSPLGGARAVLELPPAAG